MFKTNCCPTEDWWMKDGRWTSKDHKSLFWAHRLGELNNLHIYRPWLSNCKDQHNTLWNIELTRYPLLNYYLSIKVEEKTRFKQQTLQLKKGLTIFRWQTQVWNFETLILFLSETQTGDKPKSVWPLIFFSNLKA